MTALTRLSLYDEVAEQTASGVIRRYSTSFGLAARMLDPGSRRHIENVYALVRVADEIVDGPAAEAGLDPLERARALNALERETYHAIEHGFSANLVVHAFARTARETGIDRDMVAPFFASMRLDLTEQRYDEAGFARYVYGSAEVVGLMCVRAFLAGSAETGADADARYAALAPGARALGAAFQKVNFLRDLAADFDGLGRSYFPGVDPGTFDDGTKLRLLDDIDADLAVAASAIPLLPSGCRRAVALAHGLFAELSRRLRATPAATVRSSRVRVPHPVKLRIAATTWVRAR
ncbi:squalene/phytoene synthase family protein [Galbitalea sp. SE-J8]|uniref:phytoene/squalene synthase family protein n=1 Tax=Galbitalea sp. SE-J8 TaxID=3054952 RepID=UPI00259D268B|nr:squalene/phytoene synthase family protein [Galbitalea sp. SE-J8]MDM4762293.1 squalene/phytoene synthase family protein [Galbitalea sp. SE-J8]